MIEEQSCGEENGGYRIYRQQSLQESHTKYIASNSHETDYSIESEFDLSDQSSRDFRKLNRLIVGSPQGSNSALDRDDNNNSSKDLYDDLDESASIGSEDVELRSDCCELAADDILSVASESDHETRVQLLDCYISQSIEENSVKCGCHFEHPEEQQAARSFRAKLGECHRKRLDSLERQASEQSGLCAIQHGDYARDPSRAFRSTGEQCASSDSQFGFDDRGRHLFIDDKQNHWAQTGSTVRHFSGADFTEQPAQTRADFASESETSDYSAYLRSDSATTASRARFEQLVQAASASSSASTASSEHRGASPTFQPQFLGAHKQQVRIRANNKSSLLSRRSVAAIDYNLVRRVSNLIQKIDCSSESDDDDDEDCDVDLGPELCSALASIADSPIDQTAYQRAPTPSGPQIQVSDSPDDRREPLSQSDCNLLDDNSAISLSWSYESLLGHQDCGGTRPTADAGSERSDLSSREDLNLFIENCIARHKVEAAQVELGEAQGVEREEEQLELHNDCEVRGSPDVTNSNGCLVEEASSPQSDSLVSHIPEYSFHCCCSRARAAADIEASGISGADLALESTRAGIDSDHLVGGAQSSREHQGGKNPSDDNCSDNDDDRRAPSRANEDYDCRLAAGFGISEGSMRAVRDIAKVSVPSLAALQYLPAQADASSRNKRKRISRKPPRVATKSLKLADATSDKTRRQLQISSGIKFTSAATMPATSETKVSGEHSGAANRRPNAGDKENPKAILADSREDVQHDESCLLHRLCLCNCMAKIGNQIPAKPTELKQKSGKSRRETPDATDLESEPLKSPHTSKGETHSSDKRATKSTKSSSPTQLSGSSVESASQVRATPSSKREYKSAPQDQPLRSSKVLGVQQPVEKQSPKFLSILGMTTAQAKQLEAERSAERRISQPKLPAGNGKLSPARFGGWEMRPNPQAKLGLGSVGDLVTSSSVASSTRDLALESTEISHGESLGSSLYNSSSSMAHLRRDSSSVATSSASSGGDGRNIDHPTRAQSACSGASDTHNSRKTPSYRRFLVAPSRLFSAPTSSLVKLPVGLNERLAPEQQPTPRPQKQSFLSRSLNRLSGRSNRREQKRDFDKSSANQPNDCILISAKNSDASIGSSDRDANNCDADSCRPQPTSIHVRPDIKVERVSYVGDHHDANSCSSWPHARPTAAVSSDQVQRHGSEPTDFGPSSLTQQHSYMAAVPIANQRASSLPASPRSARKSALSGANKLRSGARSPRLSSSPVPFHSPASQSTKIEDGLKVCSIEHFEKHIGNIKGNQIEAQKRLFKAWINHFCPNLIRHDLIEELRDGIKLIGLLAALTNDRELRLEYEKLSRDKQSYVHRLIITPSSRLKHLSNVTLAINYLRQNVNMRLINLNPMDIVSGKPNVILGLCWNLILNFQLEQSESTQSHERESFTDRDFSLQSSISSTDSARNSLKSSAEFRSSPEPTRTDDDKPVACPTVEEEPAEVTPSEQPAPTIETGAQAEEFSWSLLDWLLPSSGKKAEPKLSAGYNADKKLEQSKKHKIITSGSNSSTSNKRNTKSKAKSKSAAKDPKASRDDDGHSDYSSSLLAFWRRVVRASRASFSLNIVLLICLAGICVVPLIKRETCCELEQAPSGTQEFSFNQRPT